MSRFAFAQTIVFYRESGIIYYIPGDEDKEHMPIPEIPKGKMSLAERDFRSRLAQIISGSGLMRGTLTAYSGPAWPPIPVQNGPLLRSKKAG